jgi:hypothetical protein
MGQREVLEFLADQRRKGNHDFLSIKDVYRSIIDLESADRPSRRNVWRGIAILKKWDMLEVKGVGEWPSYFRLKIDYVDLKSTLANKVNPNIPQPNGTEKCGKMATKRDK